MKGGRGGEKGKGGKRMEGRGRETEGSTYKGREGSGGEKGEGGSPGYYGFPPDLGVLE